MLKTKKNYDIFSERLLSLNRYVEHAGKLNLNDVAIHAENFYKNILKELYGWNLVNANAIRTNHEAIDLIDKTSQIFVQVTANNTPQKIRDTLEKIGNEKYAGYTLYFVFIGKQVDNRKNGEYDSPEGITFNPKEHTLQTHELLTKFGDSEPSVQQSILEILDEYFDSSKTGITKINHFNLFVIGNEKFDCKKFLLLKDRCLNYTADQVKGRFSRGGNTIFDDEAYIKFKEIPSLFMPEVKNEAGVYVLNCQDNQSVPIYIYYGHVERIEDTGKYVGVVYQALRRYEIEDIMNMLDKELLLDNWETTNTHHAIKEADLDNLLKNVNYYDLQKDKLVTF